MDDHGHDHDQEMAQSYYHDHHYHHISQMSHDNDQLTDKDDHGSHDFDYNQY